MNKKELLVKLHAYVASDGGIYSWKSKDIHGRKLRIRRRLRTKFFNKEETLIKDFIATIGQLYPEVKSIRYYPKRMEVEVRNDTVSKNILGLGKVWSANWQFPRNLTKRQTIIWIRAFSDGEGTVNNRDYDRYVAIASINFRGLKSISQALKKLYIKNKIYNINYKSHQSYRLKISRKENLIRFYKIIGFNHPKRMERLKEAIESYK